MTPILRSDVIGYLAQLDPSERDALVTEARHDENDPRKLITEALAAQENTSQSTTPDAGPDALPLNSDALTEALCARLGIDPAPAGYHETFSDFL